MTTRREVDEWIGATPDTKIPERVQQRVLERFGWKCYKTNIDLRNGAPYQIDHIVAICNGGQNRESNLAPIWEKLHPSKTQVDVNEKNAMDRRIRHHNGIRTAKHPMRKKDKKPRIITKPPLKRRDIFTGERYD